MNKLILPLLPLLIVGCAAKEADTSAGSEAATAADTAVETTATPTEAAANDSASALSAALDAQADDAKARYAYRNPADTLSFIGIEPGMTVVEALPGGGWYTKILMPYLGADGHVIGADYSVDMFALFSFATPEMLEKKKTWTQDWPAKMSDGQSENSASVSAFVFGAQSEAMQGQADAVLFIRALHNLARFDSKGGFLTTAIQDAFNALKPGGILGVVQHEARADKADDWADGSRGYLKKSFVIERMEAAGFVFEADSDINSNAKDQPGDEDIVWRLPPSLATSKENPELKASMQAIGESNRMTLRFRKPVE